MSKAKKLSEVIPKKFYNVKHGPHPVANTVGELKAILDELPDDLPVERYGVGMQCIVYNINSDAHLAIEESEGDEDCL